MLFFIILNTGYREGINKKILIIEDERLLAQVLKLKLKHIGVDADIAHNGEDGLSMLEQHSYDLVVLDLIMPIMDGFSVLKTMKEKGFDTPTIVASNLSKSAPYLDIISWKRVNTF